MSSALPISPLLEVSIQEMRHTPLTSLVSSLEKTQWLTQDEIDARQLTQLRPLIEHFIAHSPWFRQRAGQIRESIANLTSSLTAFSLFPVTTRRDLQNAKEDLHSRQVPVSHLPIMVKKSPGSTGEPTNGFSAQCL
jgi:phenylacetate-coenzyme A ligase PaaK-like adenylate-forming protein